MTSTVTGVTGAVLVAGGGIAGIQASLDLANAGYKVYLLEKSASIGGVMAQLDKTFPTNDCAMCIMSPKLVEVGRHINIELLTLAEVQGISGAPGNFLVQVRQQPRYIDLEKCIACGKCAEKCPKKVTDSYNQGLVKRRAAYVLYPQAVPLKYVIDADNCIYFQKKGKCRACEKFCPADAVNFDDQPRDVTLAVGAVILAPGFKAFDPSGIAPWCYDQSPNIMTSLEFERILSASGPTSGHLVRPLDQKEPQRIAWLQCVGSRDLNQCDHPYCSSVCCMYAIKQAIIAREHAHHPLECSVFFMDMRTHGKGFEDCYNQARDKHGIQFIRSRVHTLLPNAESGDIHLRWLDDVGQEQNQAFDLVILSVGLEITSEVKELAARLDVTLTPDGFTSTDAFAPVATSRPGIYACGVLAGPKDIPQSVIEAGSAALSAGLQLQKGRHGLTRTLSVPTERDIRGEAPAIGVFVCHCGINISGVVNVPEVAEYAKTLPRVVFATDNLYSCSQDTQNLIAEVIREKGLNRMVVAACSPKTHEPLFQETLAAAGLNKYLLEFVNIRNQDSWVHAQDPDAATAKAKDLVRMAVAKAALLEPLREAELDIAPQALVVGGGIAGMTAAQALADQGYPTVIVERDTALGGQARHLYHTADGQDIQTRLQTMIDAVTAHPLITCHLGAELAQVEGFVGNFRSVIRQPNQETAPEITVEHGVTVIASGAQEYQPEEYLYGQHPQVITGLELDRRLKTQDEGLSQLNTAVFIQCVGSREPQRPYCSRICCTHSVASALHLKQLNPDMRVFVLYRDIRTYGTRESLYTEARRQGVIFIRYDQNHKPAVQSTPQGGLQIDVTDHILQTPLTIEADLLVLAAAIVPWRDAKLAQFFKVPLNSDGFFVEAHVKLNPSAFATDGVYLCGLAHYPKPIDESIAQAQAAVSTASGLLASQRIRTPGATATCHSVWCSSCGVCLEICPYNAPTIIEKGPLDGRTEINPVLCKGCGLCVASCRSGALHLQGYEEGQLMAMIDEAAA